jgi:tetrathionate reductase subunit B
VPACVDTCPGKVRVFGDIHDSASELRRLIESRQYRVKKAEAGTGPQIFYLL